MSWRSPRSHPLSARARWTGAGIVSLGGWILLQTLAPGPAIPWTPAMLDAARTMERALEATSAYCREAGIEVREATDPNGTCLIGPEYSELFTTLGQLEAKRTTTNPDFAALLVHLFDEAGVSARDTVAVAASGSFPALLVATVAAAEAVRAIPSVILSLGASSYGATRPELDLLDLYELLLERGVLHSSVSAASLGGSGDVGGEFDPQVRERLRKEIRDRGVQLLNEPDLASNVAERMGILGNPVAFVNVGGSDATLGTSPEILQVPPGLSLDLGQQVTLPPPAQRGVLFEMAARGIPVVHLLHVRGLTLRFALPWDPFPLPSVGATRLRDRSRGKGLGFWLLSLAYFGALGVVAFVGGCAVPPCGVPSGPGGRRQ